MHTTNKFGCAEAARKVHPPHGYSLHWRRRALRAGFTWCRSSRLVTASPVRSAQMHGNSSARQSSESGRCAKLYILRRHSISADPHVLILLEVLGPCPGWSNAKLYDRGRIWCARHGTAGRNPDQTLSHVRVSHDDAVQLWPFSIFCFPLSHWCFRQNPTLGLMLRRCVVCSCSCQEHVWWKPMQMFFANVGL